MTSRLFIRWYKGINCVYFLKCELNTVEIRKLILKHFSLQFLYAGYKVSDTLRKVLIDVNTYQDSEKQLILGYLSSLGKYRALGSFHLLISILKQIKIAQSTKIFSSGGSGAWLLIATFFRLPISGTHSIVGATIGFSLVAKGFDGLQWSTLLGIGNTKNLEIYVIMYTYFFLINHFHSYSHNSRFLVHLTGMFWYRIGGRVYLHSKIHLKFVQSYSKWFKFASGILWCYYWN